MTQEELTKLIFDWFNNSRGYVEQDIGWCVTLDGVWRLDELAEHILKELEK
jgi:hypothetical protein